MRKGKTLQPMDHRWTIPKTTKGCDFSGSKEEKVYEDG